MIGYPEAATIVGCVFATGWTIVKARGGKGHGNEVCKYHEPLMSDLVSIKNAVVSLAVYVLKEAEKEGRDLRQEIINTIIKK